ncbi:hypothetical protein ACSQ67_009199 [Phaseolus vulgaris]
MAANNSLSFAIQRPSVLQKKVSPPIVRRPSASLDFDSSRSNNNGTVDHFGLFTIHDAKQEVSTTPPSWITFDWKDQRKYIAVLFLSVSVQESVTGDVVIQPKFGLF